jgi:hypothetical protein
MMKFIMAKRPPTMTVLLEMVGENKSHHSQKSRQPISSMKESYLIHTFPMLISNVRRRRPKSNVRIGQTTSCINALRQYQIRKHLLQH